MILKLLLYYIVNMSVPSWHRGLKLARAMPIWHGAVPVLGTLVAIDDCGEMDEYVGCKVDINKDERELKFTQPVMIQTYQISHQSHQALLIHH